MTLSTTAFDYVRELVHRQSAIVLAPGKEYLVEARLMPLAREAGAASVDSFIDTLRVGVRTPRHADVVEALTTNETSWYRDGDPFAALREAVLPAVLQRLPAGRALRVWSAACSSGQEAYSIAMELATVAVPRGVRCEILCTDISPKMVERTLAGRYSQLEVNRGLPAARLVQNFARQGAEWEVNAALRQMVTARTMNLAEAFPPIGEFDVVFLRNVLIYFDVPTKQQILRRVRAVMRPGAFLFLGSAEVTIGVDDGWTRSTVGRCSYYQPTSGA